MKAIKIACLLLAWGGAAQADAVDQITTAADAAFARLPSTFRVDAIAGLCGADDAVNRQVVYCAATNQIFITQEAAALPQASYLVAHVMGHAVQIRHGVADVALATIRANRAEEGALRADVTRQVECIAGFLHHRAGLRGDLSAWFAREPFTGAHWGRDPLTVGPRVSIGLNERAAWFARGQAGDLARCATERFDASLLIAAFKG